MLLQLRIHPDLTCACHYLRQVISGLAIFVTLFSSEFCFAQTESAPEKKPEGVTIRILCVQSLSAAEEESILATKTADGNWIEHGTVTLRSPFITPWLQIPRGTIHLIKKDHDKIVSFGSFLIPPTSERFVVMLLPDTAKNVYRTHVIDPGKLEFQKGKALIINYGNVPAMVKMGKLTVTVNPGQQIAQRIETNEDGMYRLLVAHLDTEKKIIPCYDRFVSSNPKTRKFILLFSDPKTGLRAMTLSEFGPFE